jgi:multiple sugar transport system permease protein
MRTRFLTSKLPVYILLVLGSAMFAFPLYWMMLTALKPVEQTMAFPLKFIPRAYHAELNGKRMEVMRGRTVETPSVIVEYLAGAHAGQQVLVSKDAASDPNYRVIRDVPAGWVLVTERSETQQLARELVSDYVAPDKVESSVRLRWENFPVALATMGGRTIEEVEGSTGEISTGADAGIGFTTFLTNTIIVCVLGVMGTVFSNAIIAYGFARIKWPGRESIFAITLATMMIPGPVVMVPLYGIFKSLGWIGTLAPLWVPAWFGSAFNIFLMRQFFRTIPEDISEAARIDGCSEWRIFWNIIIPLSMPVIAVVALFHFLHSWNDFMGPLLYLTRKRTFTLALALQEYQSQHTGVQWQHLMAASAVTVLPIIILFFLAQKTFIQGIATTGGKG